MAIFGALAAGAPIGLALYNQWGFVSFGISTLVLPLVALTLNFWFQSTPIQAGHRVPLSNVIRLIWLLAHFSWAWS